MNQMKNTVYVFGILIIFLISGCGKKQENTGTKEETTTNQKEQKSAEQQKKEDSIKTAKEQNEKEIKVKEALDEERIVNDTSGQWAISASASSSYSGDKKGKDVNYSPEQMTGKPDVENYSDNGKAWTSQEADKGVEWVILNYEKPVNATEIRIRQTYNPGAIIKVELFDEKGKSHPIFEGVDKTKYDPNKIQYLKLKFDSTEYKTKSIKITLATNSVPGWNEIDAVQLVGN